MAPTCHVLMSHVAKGAVSPHLSRPLPCEPAAEVVGALQAHQEHGGVWAGNAVCPLGSRLFGWLTSCPGLGPPLEPSCWQVCVCLCVYVRVRVCVCAPMFSFISFLRSQYTIVIQILSSGINKPKFICWLFHSLAVWP